MKRIGQLKKLISSKLKEIQSKESLVADLNAKKPDQWPPGRASYTRRIIEIIANVKRQNEETKKVLLETKTIQKDINNLNGKIARSFAVSDDIIYREAKLNDWNRKCYKQLALLHSTFDQLLQSVSHVGVHLREIRHLEEMVSRTCAGTLTVWICSILTFSSLRWTMNGRERHHLIWLESTPTYSRLNWKTNNSRQNWRAMEIPKIGNSFIHSITIAPLKLNKKNTSF